MRKSILISAVMLLLLAGLTYSQTDTPEQRIGLKNEANTEKKIPQYLLDQLETAQQNENVEEENRIMNILNRKYFDVTFDRVFMPDDISTPGSDEEIYNPPYNPDWMSSDRLVYNHAGNTSAVTDRNLDMKYCEKDGKLYIAFCLNITGWRGIRVYSSSNSGLTWTSEGTMSNNSYYWTGLSMTVDETWSSRPDSVRVNLFVTRSTNTNNNGAHLRFYSLKPSTNQWIQITLAYPSSGNEFRWPSAYTNGQFHGTSTDIGCIIGEYNNALTDMVSLKQFYMANWSWSFSTTTSTGASEKFRPSAVYKNNPSGTDSVYIAYEFRSVINYQIRISRARNYGGQTNWPITAIVAYGAGLYHRKPCLAIQDQRYPSRMVVTYTQNTTPSIAYGRGKFSYSYSGGASWIMMLNLGNSYTTRYTWVSADTNGTSQYCTFIWGDDDSLNVKRSRCSFNGGTYYYDRASYYLTNTAFPVCAVYNNSSGNHRRSVFAYWRSGPHDIYFNAENLPVGITNTNGIANTYNLSQNFPNPFNPTTSINFSIPKDGLVKLVVYDILGKEVTTLVNGEQAAGNYEVTFDASKLTTGVYFYKVTSGDFSDVKKMVLVK